MKKKMLVTLRTLAYYFIYYKMMSKNYSPFYNEKRNIFFSFLLF